MNDGNMDEVGGQLQAVLSGMEQFNEKLVCSLREIDECHDRVNGLWQDSMRSAYDTRWIPCQETMEKYAQTIGPNYIEELKSKLHQAVRYLNGD